MTYDQAQEVISFIETEGYEPNEWEETFMESILTKEQDLTEKQSACLNKIYAKATGGVLYQTREYFR